MKSTNPDIDKLLHNEIEERVDRMLNEVFYKLLLQSVTKAILLFDLEPLVLFTGPEQRFAICYSPIIKINLNNENDDFHPLGYTTQGFVLAFPIDPRASIILFDPFIYEKSITSDNAIASIDDVNTLNRLQLLNGEKFLLSNPASMMISLMR